MPLISHFIQSKWTHYFDERRQSDPARCKRDKTMHIRKAGKKLARRLNNILHLCRGTYLSVENVSGLDLHRLAIPLVKFFPSRLRIILNWDFLPDRRSVSGDPFEHSAHLQFAREYLADQSFDYRKTEYYKSIVEGRLARRSRGGAQAEKTSLEFIALINKIRSEGYQPEKYGAISLVKCVDGSVMVLNGKHRLATLMALKVNDFPVVFCFDNEIRAKAQARRDAVWPEQFFKKSLAAVDKIGTPAIGKEKEITSLLQSLKAEPLTARGEVYHQIPFYEFRNLRTQIHYSETYRRLSMILSRYSDFRGKKILDLGCNVGFYSFSLAKRGADVTGVELRKECFDVAQAVAKIYELPILFLNQPLASDFFATQNREYDLTLCFSMLQWVIAQKGMEEGQKILRGISDNSKALFFDISVNTGKACLTCPPGEELSFVENFLRQGTSYTTITHMGDVQPHGRDIRHVFYCSR